MRTRHTFTATLVVALLAIAGVTAAIAADPPPPRIAFVANGRVPADALAAGPTAGQLGAPIYTTEQDSLPPATSDALDDYNPELVIVLGGSVAISDGVVAAISDVTGLPVVDPSPPPSTGVVRAAGADRFATAAAIGDLLGDYNPAALPADAKAVDSDKLDGKDSSAFQPAGNYLGKTEKAADSNNLDGKDSSAFLQVGELEVFSNNWVADGVALSPNGGRINTATGGFMINFADVPSHVAGTNYSVAQIELCYTTGANSITGTEIAGVAPDGTLVGYINDATVRSGQSCDVFAFTTPVALADGVQPLIAITFDGSIAVMSTRFVLVPTSAGHATPAAATSAPTGALRR